MPAEAVMLSSRSVLAFAYCVSLLLHAILITLRRWWKYGLHGILLVKRIRVVRCDSERRGFRHFPVPLLRLPLTAQLVCNLIRQLHILGQLLVLIALPLFDDCRVVGVRRLRTSRWCAMRTIIRSGNCTAALGKYILVCKWCRRLTQCTAL